MRLDLDNSNVKEVEVKCNDVRTWMDGENETLSEDLETWFDDAQGAVFTDQEKEYYLVIKVVK